MSVGGAEQLCDAASLGTEPCMGAEGEAVNLAVDVVLLILRPGAPRSETCQRDGKLQRTGDWPTHAATLRNISLRFFSTPHMGQHLFLPHTSHVHNHSLSCTEVKISDFGISTQLDSTAGFCSTFVGTVNASFHVVRERTLVFNSAPFRLVLLRHATWPPSG